MPWHLPKPLFTRSRGVYMIAALGFIYSAILVGFGNLNGVPLAVISVGMLGLPTVLDRDDKSRPPPTPPPEVGQEPP